MSGDDPLTGTVMTTFTLAFARGGITIVILGFTQT